MFKSQFCNVDHFFCFLHDLSDRGSLSVCGLGFSSNMVEKTSGPAFSQLLFGNANKPGTYFPYIVFGAALEKGFCPFHPQVDFCTVSYTIDDTIISCKAGFCLGGRVRYNGLVGHVNCIVDGCSNVTKQFNGKCYMHFYCSLITFSKGDVHFQQMMIVIHQIEKDLFFTKNIYYY